MSNPLIRSCDNFVVIEPLKAERFLNVEETLEWLKSWLKKKEELPEDLNNYSSIDDAAKRLLDTACDLEIEPGFRIQWFAIRLDPKD
tara:strand:- start:769 stop:1029 length:261 start_codon:yes stop_codon:yes gene_type:complete